LPLWLSFDSKSRIFRGKVPIVEKMTTYDIFLKVSNGEGVEN
jgi:hypothetical protein